MSARELSMASLFDGIGVFPLAAERSGITPVWASEIELFPIAVTKIRFPKMVHMGDITKLQGADLPHTDAVCGGFPCQDCSIASNRRLGLFGARSGLFFEMIRVIKEMRDADRKRGRTAQSIRPRFIVAENVPGLFSSNNSEDFRIVLEELCRIVDDSVSVPRPPGGKWLAAGSVVGDGFSLAYRTLQASHWGVAQRRRRIFIVVDLGGGRAGQILFNPCRMPWDPAPGGETGQSVAGSSGESAANTGRNCLTPWDTQQARITAPDGVAPTLTGADKGGGRNPGGLVFAAFSHKAGAKANSIGYEQERSPTLTSNTPSVLCLGDQGGNRMDVSENICGTLRACIDSHPPLILNAETWAISGNAIDRQPHNGGNGLGIQHEISPTITTGDRAAVFSQQRSDVYIENTVVSTQSARQYKDATDLVRMANLIRRLTPTECETLMGLEKGWTDIPGASDSKRYRALGNAIVLQCAEFIMRGIAHYLREE